MPPLYPSELRKQIEEDPRQMTKTRVSSSATSGDTHDCRRVGEGVTGMLDYVPASFRVTRHVSASLIFLWQNELKDGSLRFVRLRPQSSVVSLDDRAADRQAHAQAARLGRVEGLEQPLELRWIQPRTLSCTITSTPPEAAVPVRTSRSRAPSLTPPIASRALTIRFRITCCSCTRSP